MCEYVRFTPWREGGGDRERGREGAREGRQREGKGGREGGGDRERGREGEREGETERGEGRERGTDGRSERSNIQGGTCVLPFLASYLPHSPVCSTIDHPEFNYTGILIKVCQ